MVDVEISTSNNERTRLIPKSSSRRVLYATLISVWGTLTFGFCVGYSSPASYDLESAASQPRLSSSQQSWFSVSVSKSESKRVVSLEVNAYEIIRDFPFNTPLPACSDGLQRNKLIFNYVPLG